MEFGGEITTLILHLYLKSDEALTYLQIWARLPEFLVILTVTLAKDQW